MSFARLPVLRHGLMLRHDDFLPHIVMEERLSKVRKRMHVNGIRVLLVYSDAATNGPVCYLTNYPCFALNRRAVVVLGVEEGPFLFTAEPSRNLPKVRFFTSCDLEKDSKFFSAACRKVKALAGRGLVGLIGNDHLPVNLAEELACELEGISTTSMVKEFASILGVKDEGSLEATKKALELVHNSARRLLTESESGKDLWDLAADVDFQLRSFGCEDTNILLDCGKGRRLRPGYPEKRPLSSGDTLVFYLGAQYARQWGVVGSSISVGPSNSNLLSRLELIGKVKEVVPSRIEAGMSIQQLEGVIRESSRQLGLSLVYDIPLVQGVGYDLVEYPSKLGDNVEINMVLQVVLAVDTDDFTAMVTDMLHLTSDKGVWLSRENHDSS